MGVYVVKKRNLHVRRSEVRILAQTTPMATQTFVSVLSSSKQNCIQYIGVGSVLVCSPAFTFHTISLRFLAK